MKKFISNCFNDLKRMDKILLVSSLALLAIGLVMVFSASNVSSSFKLNDQSYFFRHQLFFMAIGLFISIFIIFINSKIYGPASWFLMIGLIVCLILVLVISPEINYAHSWLPITKSFRFQPSEFIKIVTIIWMAYLCSGIPNLKLWVRYVALILFVGLAFILISVQPDLGTAGIYLAIVFFMFLSLIKTPVVKKYLLIGGGSVIAIILAFVLFGSNKSLLNRFLSRTDFTNPCSEEKFYTTGTQLCNGYIAFNNGGLFGVGLGNSTQKYLYLPEAYTDFIFAIVVEELGFIPSILILALMFVCIWRIFIIGKRANSAYKRLICYGIFWYLLIHITINLLGITGLMPLTGVPLPFLSYGGSFLICLIAALSFVQRVNIETLYEKNK